MRSRSFPWLLLLLAVAVVPAQSQTTRTDHPLIAAYEGAVIRSKDVRDFDVYQAFTGMDETGKTATTLELQGKVTKILYKMPKDRSVFEVFSNYQMALEKAGAEVIFSCDQKNYECAQRYAGPTLQKASGLHGVMNTAGRYLLARLTDVDNTAYIALSVGPVVGDIHVIEVQAMERDKVSVDAAALGKGLDANGYVVVEGVYFETDKALLRAESTEVLKEMAKLFGERPDLNVYIVGHTDSQGSFEHNMSLSSRRARAVVAALVEDFGIVTDRVQAHGVGPLAPYASNASDGGRALNRRVVLVAR